MLISVSLQILTPPEANCQYILTCSFKCSEIKDINVTDKDLIKAAELDSKYICIYMNSDVLCSSLSSVFFFQFLNFTVVVLHTNAFISVL